MLAAEQSLRDGDLAESLATLQEQIRKEPANPKYRIFLFQLLVLKGDWDRALTQLSVAGEMDAGTLAMVQTYRESVQCEVLRAEVFAGKKAPMIFGDPEQWVALMMEALRVGAQGEIAKSQQLRDEALEMAPASSGSIDGEAFEWIADADARLGPLLEVIINGRYFWVPFDRIQVAEIEAPEDLRDQVWMPAHFMWSNGGETVGLIPTRYPGSETSDDPLIALARKTVWQEHEAELYTGLGQRMLATDVGEYSLMDIRKIQFDATDEAPAEVLEESADG